MAISQLTLQNSSRIYARQGLDESKYSPIYGTYGTKKKAFLSHSSKDVDLVKGLLVILGKHGFDLYVDWKDQEMPERPNAKTAKILQDKIKSYNYFIFLATENSKAARWCPWELGYADSASKAIYIVPTEQGGNTYGNEYLDLYNKIDISNLIDNFSRTIYNKSAANETPSLGVYTVGSSYPTSISSIFQ